jgi:hypothetical protein
MSNFMTNDLFELKLTVCKHSRINNAFGATRAGSL